MTARTAAAPGARGKRVKTHARSPPRRELLRPALPSSTCLARFAKRSVACVSEADATVGETLTIMAVLPPPESAGCKSNVSFESRYGTWGCFAARAWITLVSADSDELIFTASFFCLPSIKCNPSLMSDFPRFSR